MSDPRPFEPRVLTLLSELDSLLVMLDSDSYEEFDGVWTRLLSEMVDLWEDMVGVETFDAERMSISLMRGARRILDHDFLELDVGEEFFRIAATMLGLAYGLINFDEPMTTETALLACQVADTMSTAFSLGGLEELDLWQSALRDAIVMEVLRRDPTNETANQLNSIRSISESDFGELARSEVADWHWA